ncbi:nucleotide-binding protein [Cellulosimicrobium sp. TH-20]|uniref:TIR domain-containing protein n=1 Tax=Cellulosimicrobium sp. TH-20 TaxID=1980001 RepID=UPI001581F71B
MSSVFRLQDRRYLVAAVGDLTHAHLSGFESGLEFKTDASLTKAQRAADLIEHIFEEPDPDPLIVDLLNFIYVDGPGVEWRLEPGTQLATLKKRVLDPRGIVLGPDGFELPGREAHPSTAPNPTSSTPAPATTQKEAPVNAVASSPGRDPSRVFIVHGRDERPVAVLSQFLMFIGLRAMSWAEARERTGKPQPTTYEIVTAGMAGAGAIIVIFSPDDEARLKPDLAPGEPEETLTGQARQNVILEAGLAFASDPLRTVFVQSQRTRPITDIDGFNWVPLTGEWKHREDLYKRLRDAGARVEREPGNLSDPIAGPFKVV